MAGYTERVDTLITVLEDCAKSRYKRKIASEAVISSKTGQNVSRRRMNSSLRNKLGISNQSVQRSTSICLEFDANGTPLIQGLVAESIDGSILLENVSNCRTSCNTSFPSAPSDKEHRHSSVYLLI